MPTVRHDGFMNDRCFSKNKAVESIMRTTAPLSKARNASSGVFQFTPEDDQKATVSQLDGGEEDSLRQLEEAQSRPSTHAG